jgi:hypothetical protein
VAKLKMVSKMAMAVLEVQLVVMHFPASPLSQKKETGVHWKIEMAVKVMTHTKMRQREK